MNEHGSLTLNSKGSSIAVTLGRKNISMNYLLLKNGQTWVKVTTSHLTGLNIVMTLFDLNPQNH